MLFAVSLMACWRMVSCCRRCGFFSVLIIAFTCVRRSMSRRRMVGSTAGSEVSVGSAGVSASSSGRATVVKQMLYSRMIEG